MARRKHRAKAPIWTCFFTKWGRGNIFLLSFMRINLNDEIYEIPEGASLSLLVKKLQKNDFNGWAVAVNEVVIPSDDFENTFLTEGDRVLEFVRT